jgi:hypothetical protein
VSGSVLFETSIKWSFEHQRLQYLLEENGLSAAALDQAAMTPFDERAENSEGQNVLLIVRPMQMQPGDILALDSTPPGPVQLLFCQHPCK